jgi:hypothetical protein
LRARRIAAVVFALRLDTGRESTLARWQLGDPGGETAAAVAQRPRTRLLALARRLAQSGRVRRVLEAWVCARDGDARPGSGARGHSKFGAKVFTNRAVLRGESIDELAHPRLPVSITL